MGQALSRKRFTFTPGSASPNGEIPTAKPEINGTARKDTEENVVAIETTDKTTTAVTPTATPDTTITSDAADTTVSGDVTSSSVTNEETPSPTKKEKRKIRKLFTFSLKRSRPGSGRKKSKKQNGSTSQTSSPDTTKEETRQSLFLEEFEIPECHDTDAVDLSDPEESGNISKNIDPENTSTPNKDESFKKNKKGSKSPKSPKKSKKIKTKSEKKKKNEEAKAEKKREKEEKAKKEKEQKESLKKKKDSQKDNGTVLIVEESVEPLQVEISESQPTSPDVTSTEAEVQNTEQTTEDHIKVDEAENQEQSQSPPSSPRSDDDGTPKRVALGPRLKTSILRKVSSGQESESSRVTLTRPKTVEIPNPPPRKHRKRPVSVSADTSTTSVGDSSVSTLDQSSVINESSIAEQSTEHVTEEISGITTEKKEETKESLTSDENEISKSFSIEIAEAINALEMPVTKETSEGVESGVVVENKTPLEIEIITPVSSESVSKELDENMGKDTVVESTSSLMEDDLSGAQKKEDDNTQENDQNGESRPEEETVIKEEIVEKEQSEIPVIVDVSSGSESQEMNSDFVSSTTINLVMSSPVTEEASSMEVENKEAQIDNEIRAIAKAHTELIVNGALETLKSELNMDDEDNKEEQRVESKNSGREPIITEELKEESALPSQEVIAVNKYSIETGETCTVITVGQKSEIDEIKTVDKGPEEPLDLSNMLTISGDSTEITESSELDNASPESPEVESSVASVSLSCEKDSSVSEAKVESEFNESAKDITDGDDGAINKSSDLSVDSNMCIEHSTTQNDSNVCGENSSIKNDANVCVDISSAESDATVCADTSSTENDANLCAKSSSTENDSSGLSCVSQTESESKDCETVTCSESPHEGDSEQCEESEEMQFVTETVTIFQTRLVKSVSIVKETNNNKILSSHMNKKDEASEDTTLK